MDAVASINEMRIMLNEHSSQLPAIFDPVAHSDSMAGDVRDITRAHPAHGRLLQDRGHKNNPWPAVMQVRGMSCAGGGAENRTPVHGRKSRGVYRLSRCSSRKATRHTDKRGDLPPVQAWLAAYRLRPRVQSPDNDPVRMPGIEHAVGRAEPKLGSQGDSVALCALERNNFAS